MSCGKQLLENDNVPDGDRAGRRGFFGTKFDREDEHTSKSSLSEKTFGGMAVDNKNGQSECMAHRMVILFHVHWRTCAY